MPIRGRVEGVSAFFCLCAVMAAFASYAPNGGHGPVLLVVALGLVVVSVGTAVARMVRVVTGRDQRRSAAVVSASVLVIVTLAATAITAYAVLVWP